jgi:pimeloyl-ACP methyl ester carboxylesterase
VPVATVDGIATRYEVVGSGPPVLMYAPGGFDSSIEKWTSIPSYASIELLARLQHEVTCILFDRRDTGESGGRIERVRWHDYAAHGKALLDHLGIERAHIMGGCIGCPCAVAFGVAYPQAVLSLVLYSPVGGVKYRLNSQQRFAEHLAFVQREGLAAVVALVEREGKGFGTDARGGPWAAVIKHDRDFAAAFARQDVERYKLLLVGMARTMYDRDTAPGAEPEDLMRLDLPALIVPGNDAAHATSAAYYLSECLPRAEFWPVFPAERTAENTPARVLEFLRSNSPGG